MICTMDFDMFFGILIFAQSEDFAKAIAFAWWPIFKMLSFLEYLVFIGAGFFHKTTLKHLQNGFWQVFLNFNFWPKVTILQRL